MRPWFSERPDDYSAVRNLLAEHYPSLHTVLEGDRAYIRGALPIVVDNVEIDRFQIEIEFPDNYPRDIPVVRETAGRLEKIDDRHFNWDKTACLFLKDESHKHYTPQSTIIDFIEVPVKSFFLWQIEYDLTGGKPTRKARSHGVEGTVEFYKEELGVDSLNAIITFLEYHTSIKIKGHWICYCGSALELRRCHLATVKDLKEKIRRDYAQKSLNELRGYATSQIT